jgi:protein involved in polysaccharide export with SLBB domain
MNRFNILAFSIASVMLLNGCSQILEPISLMGGKQNNSAANLQEEFEVRIKSLTFKTAKKSNNDPYPRQLMSTGIGSEAKVFNEADFVNSEMPASSPDKNLKLGVGDELLFTQLNEFVVTNTAFPNTSEETDYLIGVGDKLTLVQLNDAVNNLSNIISSMTKKGNEITIGNYSALNPSESFFETSGLVGSDGNMLLLGLGSIKAENRSLNEIRTEVRNILIRNGLAPSFQLEITGFNSKKAFITFPNPSKTFGKNSIAITSLPITLKELAITFGLQPSSKEKATITLARDGQKYRMTAKQLFDKASPRIVVKDRDEIQIEETSKEPTAHRAVVGSRGNILLHGIGSIKAENRSLDEIQSDITQILIAKGMNPSYQLEITKIKSKKFFLVSKKYGSKVIPLSNSKLTLKEALLSYASAIPGNDFMTVDLVRNDKSYQMTFQEILNGSASKIIIQNGDSLELKGFKYKPGTVFALSGAGNAQLVPINPSNRETLADILFTPRGALNNLLAERSEVYLLRGKSPSTAYHLDAQNVSRILVAAQTELRPNDIVYVADRPIISFSRTLAEILPLRNLLRDIEKGDIP